MKKEIQNVIQGIKIAMKRNFSSASHRFIDIVTLFIINPLTLLADNKQKQLTPITTDVIKYLQLM